jgi:hypothetical protein
VSDTTKNRRAKTIPFPSFDLAHTELTICELKQVPSPSPPRKDEKANYFYSANTRDISHIGRPEGDERTWTIGWCELSAAKQVEGQLRAEVTATYVFVYTDPHDPQEGTWSRNDVTKLVISIGIWPRFRDLVAHMMAQGSTVFPPLPPAPDKIGHTPKKASADQEA